MDAEFGTAMHSGVQASLEGDDGIQVFDTYWQSLREKEMVQSKFNWEQLADMGPKFLTRFDRLHKKDFEVLHMEKDLAGELGGFPLTGTPDLLGSYKGIPSIVDFKTSNWEYVKEKIIVNEQMPIYHHLAQQQLGYVAQQMVYKVFVKSQLRIQTLVLPIEKQTYDNAIRNVLMMCADLQKREQFPRNPNSCMMGTYKCSYFNRCHGG